MKAGFAYGTECSNDGGNYKVIADPVKGRMTVKYENGTVKLLSVDAETGNLAAFARLKAKKTRVEAKRSKVVDDHYFVFLGLVSKTSILKAEVASHAKAKFDEQYAGIKGKEAVDVYVTDNKGGVELRLAFPRRFIQYAPNSGISALACDLNAHTVQLNYNDLLWQLLEMGFDLGSTHDADKIRAAIPPEHVEKFDHGRKLASMEPDLFEVQMRNPVTSHLPWALSA